MTIKLVDLLPSWQIGLQAQRLSPNTIRNYRKGALAFLHWCEATGTEPELTKATVQAFLVDLLDQGKQPTTARSRWSALKRFSWWLADEGHRPTNELKELPPPQLDTKPIQPLTDDELRDLIKVCSGKAFRERRDEALIRLLAETGMRAGECCSLTVDDVDIPRGLIVVQRAKNRKGRRFGFGAQTARALDRYRLMRAGHRLADTSNFWLGDRSRSFSYPALYRAVQYRAKLAGIENMHPHKLRNTQATRWLDRGGSESGLMANNGWSSSAMLRRYTAATAEDRAADEARRLGLGDI